MRRLLSLLFIVLLFSLFANTAHTQSLPQKRIGMVIDGPWSGNDEVRLLFQTEILELAEGEFDVIFPEDKRIVADWSFASIQAAVDKLLNDPGVDIVLTLGVVSSQYVCQKTDLPKPVLAPTVIDQTVQQLPNANGTSGVKNLNYLVFPNNFRRDIEVFLEIVEFRKLAIFFNKNISEVLPDLEERVKRVIEPLGIQVQVINVDESADDAFNEMVQTTEAAYMAPLQHITATEWESLVKKLTDRDIPTFSLLGEHEVERGIMASMSVDPFPRLARRTALNMQRIMIGDDPGTLPTTFTPGEQLTINMATARAVKVYPPWSVLTDAVVINRDRTEITRVLTINKAIQEAIDMNLDLAAKQRALAASEQEIKIARANLLPQIDLSSLALWIDPESADQSNFQQAQFTLDGQATLEQVIFADPVWADYTIQKHLQDARTREWETDRLDIVQDAAQSYLVVLLANTFENIQLENLKRTRETSNWPASAKRSAPRALPKCCAGRASSPTTASP